MHVASRKRELRAGTRRGKQLDSAVLSWAWVRLGKEPRLLSMDSPAAMESRGGLQPPRLAFRTSRRSHRWMFAVVLLISAVYSARELKRGWVPHDEGALAESAERVLQGELPHRDFDDIYTGGLSYLNAAVFRALGENLAAPRYVLYAFLLAWIAAVYYIASRLVPVGVAGAVTLLAVAWSVPNYSAAMPSWYNLFFATFGVAALMRFIESEDPVWMFLAGACGGVSFLFKLSGLYFAGGAVLYLLFRQQGRSEETGVSRVQEVGSRAVTWVAVILYLVLLLLVVGKDFSAGAFFYLFLPAAAIGGGILWRDGTLSIDRRRRLGQLARELFLFGAGVAVPVAMYLVPYVLSGSVGKFWWGVFVLPGKRFMFASLHPPLVRLVYGVAVDAVFVLTAFRAGAKVKKVAGWILLLGVPALVALGRVNTWVYQTEWGAIWTAMPVGVLLGIIILIKRGGEIGEQDQQRIFLLLSVAAACSLIQFPYGAPIYFVYTAPLVLLATTAVISVTKPPPPTLLLVAAYVLCMVYVTFDVTPGFVYQMGDQYSRNKQTERLDGARGGGLWVLPTSAREYAALTDIVSAHVGGKYIYATPDCPEVYFLADRRNPTRTLFDFLDDPAGRSQRILAAIHAHDVHLVVLNREPYFSGPVANDLRAALDAEFPEHAETRQFEVRWKP
jgi:hypothetical protein